MKKGEHEATWQILLYFPKQDSKISLFQSSGRFADRRGVIALHE